MKQHIELPSDPLIYLALKSFENGISERCGEPTIRKSLKLLESEGYIKIEDIILFNIF